MNFHVYLDEELGREIQQICLTTHKKRNAVVREALRLYVKQQKTAVWPESVLSFQGIKDFPPFELSRNELLPESRPTFLE
jgi:hypothetical protein